MLQVEYQGFKSVRKEGLGSMVTEPMVSHNSYKYPKTSLNPKHAMQLDRVVPDLTERLTHRYEVQTGMHVSIE